MVPGDMHLASERDLAGLGSWVEGPGCLGPVQSASIGFLHTADLDAAACEG